MRAGRRLVPTPAAPAPVRRLLPLLVAMLAVAAAGCGDGGQPSAEPPATTSPATSLATRADDATPAAADLLQNMTAQTDDPVVVGDAAVNLDYVHRRFGAAAHLGWVPTELTSRALAMAEQPGAGAGGQLQVFLRMIDPAATLAAPPADLGIEGGSAVTAEGLWCDRHPLPADFGATVDAAIAAGGYELTHAAVGLVLAAELGCQTPPAAADALDRAVPGLQALLDEPEDLSLEACGVLGYVGRPDLIPAGFVTKVEAAQAADGGWPQDPGGPSTVHATEWGLRCLLEAKAGSTTPRAPWAAGAMTLPAGG